MSPWSGKYIIGLTGNIATGKSVVRKMLEHLGAYGIDADILAHRAIAKGSPGYEPTIEAFGKWILTPEGQIDRKRLGEVVFSNPQALETLETIIHPLVGQAVRMLIEHAKQKVIVIEAIKLLEGELRDLCDQIWVTKASEEKQLERLMYKRKMSLEEAQQRINAQGPEEAKLEAADVVIENAGTFEATWNQVSQAWKSVPQARKDRPPKKEKPSPRDKKLQRLTVQRATPRQTDEIAAFLNQQTPGQPALTREDIMQAFGEKAYLLLHAGDQVAGLLGWQVENLITRVSEVMIRDKAPTARALEMLIRRMEEASEELQSEVALVFLAPSMAKHKALWKKLGYEQITVDNLTVRSWKNAAQETITPDMVMYFKRLKEHRVLRPM
jgi:dephospho-CoA kinase